MKCSPPWSCRWCARTPDPAVPHRAPSPGCGRGRSVVPVLLPAQGAGITLERSDHLVGDPAAVEATGLRTDDLVVDQGAVDAARVERHGTAQVLVARGGVLVRPADRRHPPAVDDGVPVGRVALPLAPRAAARALENPVGEVVPR